MKSADIIVLPGTLSGHVAAIPSKSHAQRILIAAALADQPTQVKLSRSTTLSDDLNTTLQTLRFLGATTQAESDHITVTPSSTLGDRSSSITVDCGQSAATARLLLPILAAVHVRGTLTGSGSLLNRPFAPLCAALAAGALSCDRHTLPITWQAHTNDRLQAADFQLPGDESSQYLSGLLFALPLLAADSTIQLTTPLQSAGYVDLTLAVLRQFGITVQCTDDQAAESVHYRIAGGQRYTSPGSISVEGDWSNSANWLAAGLTVTGLNPHSLQRDRSFSAIKDQPEIDATDIPDLVPILAVCAALRRGQTRIYGIKRLRLKESDRIKTTHALLQALGCEVYASDNQLLICGSGTITGGTVDAAGDHRIVMAAAIAGSYASTAVKIVGADAVTKTYPDFFTDYCHLGGQLGGRLGDQAAGQVMG
ncbi:MAG: 3-phosphoshikimate 1-carboxyvinyltransferase [Coriobacteriia bacterium]|nr:3-phosphoshikimate 1-carboxyvinyltransferase [Coriobacteriia bacterium]